MNQRASFIGIVSTLAAVLVIWKTASVLTASPVLPPPEAVIIAFFHAASGSEFWIHFLVSGRRVCISIAVSWIIAFPVGALMGYSSSFDKALSPLVFMAYPVPKMVLLPVVVLLFGLGDLSKVILITLILFFQVLVSTRDGVKNIDRKYYDSVRSMGGGTASILRHVVIPGALPHSFTALRISTGTAISVLFFAESFATTSGLGYLIMDAWTRADYILIFVGIAGMSIMGLMLYEFFAVLERVVCRWNTGSVKTESGNSLISRTVVYSKMIKLHHTVFALPFALSGLILAVKIRPVTIEMVMWIFIAIVGGRSAAMGFNRIADADIDAENPRTAMRDIPAGRISRKEALMFTLFSSALLVYASAMLSWMCFRLSFPLLVLLFFYSYTKRFTWLAHIYLGFAIGLAPVAVWIAIAGMPGLPVILLALALMTHIAGFDILYACQDIEFDREKKLYSIPARFGMQNAFRISALLHIVSVILLASIYFTESFGIYYFIFITIIAVLYVIEHRIVKPDDISSIDIAFFHINSAISVLVFVTILTGMLSVA